MSAPETCHESSLAAGEELAGTATRADRWLLLEARGAWGRDVESTELPEAVRAAATGFAGRVQLLRRPGRGPAAGRALAYVADTSETGGTLRRLDTPGDLESGELLQHPVLLVCCHGRRDACCARLGTPVFDALGAHVAADQLWQTSHVGGHRFAANILSLPTGVLLGRVPPGAVAAVAGELLAGRIPLAHYRGRTLHAPEAQAADAAVRRALNLPGLTDVRVVESQGGRIRLETPSGIVDAEVETLPGPLLSESCGSDQVPATRYSVRW